MVLPPEVVFLTLRIKTHDEGASSQQLRENLDLLEEKCANAHLQMLAYKKVIARLYDHRICPRSSGWATWCCGKLMLATRPGPVESWRRIGKDPTELWMLSEKGLTHWEWWRDECYQEHGTSQTFKKFTHNVEKVL
ncbi:hypothetical protein B296_00036651 [Ensete ventricosum]|uniref:Uncharacterized protein n=1 Tax=Ensete ventricosum TaxID=4639 RepID=A0A426Y7Z9_ENSVE|nr:hypothetical protein B296_00036651 [Ensete ventricosum]